MDLKGVWDGMENKSRQAISVDDKDYIKDGLLYCHKCNTPKQVRLNIPNVGEFTPYCLCQCEKAKQKAEEDELNEKRFQQTVTAYRDRCFSDAKMQEWTFENDDGERQITETAKKYCFRFKEMDNKGLLLFGKNGTGKSYAAACICNYFIDNGIPCFFTNMTWISNSLFGEEEKQDFIDRLTHYKILVIDDFGAERSTPYIDDMVFSIIDGRYRAGLPIIITTNLTREKLKKPPDESKARIYSRLYEMCIFIEVTGDDRRKEEMKNKSEAYKRILEL